MSGLPFFAQHSINRLRDVVVRSALHQGVTPAAGEWVDLHLGLAQQLRQAVAVIEQARNREQVAFAVVTQHPKSSGIHKLPADCPI